MSPKDVARVWVRYARAVLGVPVGQIALRNRFPTSHFHEGATVDARSSLEGFNVIFGNTNVLNSSLGRHTYIQKNSSVMNSRIGRFCSIAANVKIGLGRHPIEMVSTHPAFYSNSQPLAKTFSPVDSYNPFQPIDIGNDVWIGQSALVIDGVKIGNGAAIAANAVVTKDVPPYAIVAGVPAKLVRFRFGKDTIDALESIKWWDKPDEWLAANRQLFADPAEFVRQVGESTVDGT